MIYLAPLRWLQREYRRQGKRLMLRTMAMALPPVPEDSDGVIVLVGRPLWGSVPVRMNMAIEEYISELIEHETLHLVLGRIGEKKNDKIDKRWPYGVPR